MTDIKLNSYCYTAILETIQLCANKGMDYKEVYAENNLIWSMRGTFQPMLISLYTLIMLLAIFENKDCSILVVDLS